MTSLPPSVPTSTFDAPFNLDDDLEQILSNLFPSNPETTLLDHKITFDKTMGFSGARVLEVECTWEGSNQNPKTIFIKEISVSDTTEERVKNSYRNEYNFLKDYAERYRKSSINIPKCYKILNNDHNHYLFLSESLRNTGRQVVSCNDVEFSSCLSWLGDMHGLFHGELFLNPNKEEEEEIPTTTTTGGLGTNGLWEEGTHLALSKRPALEVEKLPLIWKNFCKAFNWEGMQNVGERLTSNAWKISSLLSPDYSSSGSSDSDSGNKNENITIVHGDFKTGNIFFTGLANAPTCEVFDFQWTGYGKGVTDLVYLLTMCISDQQLTTFDIEDDMLKPYYKSLTLKIEERKKSNPLIPSYSYSTLQNDFKLALMDITRWIMACRMGGKTPEDFRLAREENNPNHGVYRRSEKLIFWLMERTEEYLDEFGW